MKPIKVMIADDNAKFKEELKKLIEKEEGFEFCSYCPNDGDITEIIKAQGTLYRPAGGVHEATTPVTPDQFREFMEAEPGTAQKLTCVESGGQLHTSQESISAFTLWLTRQCEKAGTIGRDHSLIARPEPGTEAGPDLRGYRLYTMLVQKTPISIYSNPPGARVTLNGLPLGVTPMQDIKVPPLTLS